MEELILNKRIKNSSNSAKKENATKVVNLTSYFKKQEFKSTTEYECAIGNIMTGVALKGDIAK